MFCIGIYLAIPILTYAQSLLPTTEYGSRFTWKENEYAFVKQAIEKAVRQEYVSSVLNMLMKETRAFIYSSAYCGGDGGRAFDDRVNWKFQTITAMKFSCDSLDRLKNLRFRFGKDWTPNRDSCKPFNTTTVDFDKDEWVKAVDVITGIGYATTIVKSMKLYSNKRTIDVCTNVGAPSNKTTFFGNRLEYISGRQGCVLDGIQFHWMSYRFPNL